MATLGQRTSEIYNYILDSRDPRTKEWLFSRPTDLLGILAFYLIFCFYAGPRYMKNRPPYVMQNIIGIYNILQVTLNVYVFYQGFLILSSGNYNFRCQPVDLLNSDLFIRAINGGWWFTFSKIMDLCDTCFFILRKKKSQVTFLHVYHHTLMAFFSWTGVFYELDGNQVVMAFLNSFVHIFMYSYYFITSLGPRYRRFAWWKKYLTQMQIIQFVLIAGHTIPILFRDCGYPRWLTAVTALNALFFIYLFGGFYLRVYIRSHKSDKKKQM